MMEVLVAVGENSNPDLHPPFPGSDPNNDKPDNLTVV